VQSRKQPLLSLMKLALKLDFNPKSVTTSRH